MFTFLSLTQLANRYLPGLVLAAVLVIGVLALRSCYKTGSHPELTGQHPLLRKKQIRRLTRQAASTLAQAQATKAGADTVLAQVHHQEKHVARQLRALDSLTQRYHELSADSLVPAAELRRYLLHYRPSAD